MEKYSPSGAAPPLGTLLTLLAGLSASAILAWVYVYFVNWVPLIYFNFFATFIYGILIGAAIIMAARFGKLRNPILLAVFGVISGLLGLYFAWAIDPMARGAGFFAFDPTVLWAYIQFGYEKGFWSIGHLGQNGQNVSGIILVLVWIGEAVAIIGSAAFMAHVGGQQPFCERCERWTETKEGVQTLATPTIVDGRLGKLLEGDLSVLAAMPRPASPIADHLRLDLSTCPTCEESNFLSITQITTKTNKKGEPEASKTEILEYLIVMAKDVNLVLNAGVDPVAQPPDELKPQQLSEHG